jgi:hypothetical protein
MGKAAGVRRTVADRKRAICDRDREELSRESREDGEVQKR